MQLQYERTPLTGNPYCVIPERIAIDKLFLHQAKIDSVEVSESMIIQQAERRINYFINNRSNKLFEFSLCKCLNKMNWLIILDCNIRKINFC